MNTHITAQTVIDLLNLEPLPEEGGFFRQTYLASEMIPQVGLPTRYSQPMSFGSAIYVLLTPTDFSAMHRLNTDEIYHFYLGDPVDLLLLHPHGAGEIVRLGNDLLAGMHPQFTVPHGAWQGSKLATSPQHQDETAYGFALLGTTMAPAFDWSSFELGQRESLSRAYPHFTQAIAARSRVGVAS